VRRDRELGGRDHQRDDAAHRALGRVARTVVGVDGEEDGGFAAVAGEQLARVQAAARAGRPDPLRPRRGVQFSQRPLPPGQDVLAVDRLPDADGRGRLDRPVGHRGGLSGARKQAAQRVDRGVRLRQLRLQPVKMRRDQRVAGRGVGRGEHRLDVRDGHLQVTQPADHLDRGDLRHGVVAVARVRVHLGRLQQAHLVVVPQRLDAQVRDPGELAHRERPSHGLSVNPPPAGESSGPDGARRVEGC
jgi:hypothetical protein